MMSQYVFPSSRGLFRIVQHGGRWRSLLETRELSRHASAEAALVALRLDWPQARLPQTLSEWRYVSDSPALPYARRARATNAFRPSSCFDPTQPPVRRSRRGSGRSTRDVTDLG